MRAHANRLGRPGQTLAMAINARAAVTLASCDQHGAGATPDPVCGACTSLRYRRAAAAISTSVERHRRPGWSPHPPTRPPTVSTPPATPHRRARCDVDCEAAGGASAPLICAETA
ncbi:hypothetical protein PSPO01_13500 [Paraphaeosphaeria sporulosa]